jgi:hypothetical protein
MLRFFGILLALLAASPAMAGGKEKDYAGADGGYLIYSVGAIDLVAHYTFNYHRIGSPPAEDWRGRIQPRLGGAIYLKVKNPDYTQGGTGHVVIRRLPPGNYAVDSFSFGGMSPTGGGIDWKSSEPFALPFEIKPGEAVYIGSFARCTTLGTSLQPVLGAVGYFVVADQGARDLAIARPRLPAGVAITSSVTDVSAFGAPIFRSSPL